MHHEFLQQVAELHLSHMGEVVTVHAPTGDDIETAGIVELSDAALVYSEGEAQTLTGRVRFPIEIDPSLGLLLLVEEGGKTIPVAATDVLAPQVMCTIRGKRFRIESVKPPVDGFGEVEVRRHASRRTNSRDLDPVL